MIHIVTPYLYGMSSWIQRDSEGLIKRRLPVMSANSGLFLYDLLLCSHIHHIQLDIQVWYQVNKEK